MSDFEAGSTSTFPAPAAFGRMVTADFDGDGDADILYQTGGDGTAFQYARSNGDGTFTILSQAASPFAGLTLVNHNGGNYYAADFDGDGDIDLLGAVNSATGSYYRNDGSSFSLQSSATFPAAAAATRMVAGDFDGDGDADILYQTGGNGTPFQYARSNGDGTFTILSQSVSPFAGVSLPDHNGSNFTAGDFDGDGDVDLHVGLNSSGGSYFVNPGAGLFTPESTTTFPAPLTASRQLAGDFDADGDLDILYQTGASGTPFQYGRNNGDGTFTILSQASSPFAGLTLPDHNGTSNYYAADFDGDGDTDLLAGANGTTGSYFFQVGAPPALVSANPADDSTGIAPASSIFLTFSEAVTKGSGNIRIVRTSDGTTVETISVGSAQVTGSGTTWAIDPSITLANSTAYAVQFDAGTFVDGDGAIFAGITDNTTLNFTTVAANTPPALAANTGLTLDEGSTGTITAAQLDYNDAEQADTALVYTVTSLATNGTLRLNGTPLALNGTFTQADINNGLVTFQHDGSETTGASFGFSLTDGNNTFGGQTFSFTVTPVNDAPVVTGMPATLTMTEGDPGARLFPAVTLSDAEGNYDGGTLTVTGLELDDFVYIANQTLQGTIGLYGLGSTGEVRYGGVSFGTFTVSASGLSVTFNSAATAAWVEALIESINYAYNGNAPASHDLAFTLTDGAGDAFTHTVSLDMTAIDDALGVAITTPVVAAGAETQVNTATTNNEQQPVIVGLDGGGYVVAWESVGGSSAGIRFQRYDASGTPQGSETAVDGNAAGRSPSLTALAGGGFAVSWNAYGADGDTGTIHMRLYDAAGAAAGSAVQVNTTSAGNQSYPAITALAGGGFVVSWQSYGQDGHAEGIYARLFDATGAATTGEFQVSTYTFMNQHTAAVAALADGGFVVVWQSQAQETNIYFQRYDAGGNEVGGETEVALLNRSHFNPSVAGLADGGFVITWDYDGTGSDNNIHSRRYDADGNAVDGDIRINTTTTNAQVQSSVTALADGGYMITWMSPDGSSFGIYGQRFDAAGNAVGGEVLISTTTANNQQAPSVAALADGGFVVGWESQNQDGSGFGIYAQRFALDDSALSATEQVPLDLKGLIGVNDLDAGAGAITVTLTVDFGVLDVTAGSSGASVSGSGTDTVTIAGTLAQIKALLGPDATSTVTYTADGDDPPASATLDVTADDGSVSGNDSAVIAIDPVNDAPTLSIHAPDIVAFGGEVQANTHTTNMQISPAVAMLAGGGYVIVWESYGQDGDAFGIYAQAYDIAGDPLGAEFRVSDSTAGEQRNPAVAALEGGGFVVTWDAPGTDTDVYARLYDAGANAVGGETLVNQTAAAGQAYSSVAALAGGGYLVAWQSTGQDGSGMGIYVQLFDQNGVALGAETIVNNTTLGDQTAPTAAAFADGGFVVTWVGSDGNNLGVYARTFDAAGNPLGNEVLVNTSLAGPQDQATVAVLAGGDYVIAWTSQGGGDPDGSAGVYIQRYDASGAMVGAETRVNTTIPGTQHAPAIAAHANGGFIVTWTSHGQDGDGAGIYAQRYDAAGNPLGGETLINTTTQDGQRAPAVGSLAIGGYLVAWESMGQDGDNSGIYTQLLADTYTAAEQVPLSLKGTIHVSDADAAGDVIVTLSVNYGTLSIDAGTSGVDVLEIFPDQWELTGTIAEIEALLNTDGTSAVDYLYDGDYPPPSATLTIEIDDGIDIGLGFAAIAIVPVNDAPELDLDAFEPGNDAAATWIEGQAPVVLAPFAYLDDDNEDHDGATLTVAVAGATAGDQLAIAPNIDIALSGADVIYNDPIDGPVIVGTWSGGTNGAPLVVTFNADACYCSIELLAASISYASTDDVTAPGTRTVEFTFVDGDGTANGGSDTTTASVEVDVLPAAQVIPGAGALGNEGTAIELAGVAIDVVVDDPALDPIIVRLSVDHGTLQIRTDVAGGIGVGDVIGDGTGFLILSGTQDEINATLAAAGGLLYQGDPAFAGTDELTINATTSLTVGTVDFDGLGTLPTAPTMIGRIEMRDMDGDGTADLVFGVDEDLVVYGSSVYSFTLPSNAPVQSLAFGDYDGDGIEDIAFTAISMGDPLLGFASSLSGNVEAIPLGAGLAPFEVVSADFNGDGLDDLAFANAMSGNVGILLQDPLGGFAPETQTTATGNIGLFMALGDFNRDGEIDIVVSSLVPPPGGGTATGAISFLAGHGDGTFTAPVELLATDATTGEIVVGDFDADGRLDFAFGSDGSAGSGTNGVVVVLGNGDGSFAAPVGYDTTVDGMPQQLVAEDFDNDGVLDLAVSNRNGIGSFSVLLGNGDGSFQAPVEVFTTGQPGAIAAGDPDGDGDIDIVIGLSGAIEMFNNDVDSPSRSASAIKDITVRDVVTGTAAGDLLALGHKVEVVATGLSGDDGFYMGAELSALDVLDGGTGNNDQLGLQGNYGTLGTPFVLGAGHLTGIEVLVLLSGGDARFGDTAGNLYSYNLATIDANVGAGQTLTVNFNMLQAGETATFDGSAESNGAFFFYGGLGSDVLTGGAGDDAFYFGSDGRFGAGDVVDGGAGSEDQLGLQGDYTGAYSVTFGATQLSGIEQLAVLTASDARFHGNAAALYSYDLTMHDGNVAAGQTFVVNASTLIAGETLIFDGSAEIDGQFSIHGGAGDDTITGGAGADRIGGAAGADTLIGGLGNDMFQWVNAGHSTAAAMDQVLDFTLGDLLDLSAIDADSTVDDSQDFAFIGAAAFGSLAGQLRAEDLGGGQWRVEADIDGNGIADLVIGITAGHALSGVDFVL